MEIAENRVVVVLDNSIEEGCKELCGSPYRIERLEEKRCVVWYGCNTNWRLHEGNWKILKGGEFIDCDEPEYEQLYQRMLRKEKMEKMDVRFSLLVIVSIFLGMAVYYFTKC